MDDTKHRLLRDLGRHAFRTGTEMGATLGLSRAAVHKHIQALVEKGVPIHGVPGRGYRLAGGVTLLDEALIRSRLTPPALTAVSRIDILEEVSSSSDYLAMVAETEALDGRVCLAESQTAGRGRRGRRWIATPYRDLMMSVAVVYPQWPAQLPTLGLVAALKVVEALRGLGARDLMVKWPNDVVHGRHKLCGILLDVTGEAHGNCRVIIGIGINVSMAGEAGRRIDREWTDLETVLGRVPDRNGLAAACLNSLLPALESFPSQGFEPHHCTWDALDALRGRAVAVHGPDGSALNGRAAGVDDSGRLRLEDASGGMRLFSQGEVSVRDP